MAIEPLLLFLLAVAVIGLPAVVIGLFASAFLPGRRFTVMGCSVVIVLMSIWTLLALSHYFDRLSLLWLVPLGLGLPHGRDALDFLLAVFLVWAMLAIVLGIALDWGHHERERRSPRGPT
ncbi:MAG: hypothetical protein ACE5NW_15235 [Acidiferrobacterales bacterium]